MRLIEFFAGGGMVRVAVGDRWKVVLANDLCPDKAETYRANHGSEELVVADIANLRVSDLPDADLVWGAFPCQDLSAAGNGAGLSGGTRSGAIWPMMSLIDGMVSQGRAPSAVALENVTGALSLQHAEGLGQLLGCLVDAGYLVGMLTIDAADFLPQSRVRLFIVAMRPSEAVEAMSGPRPGDYHSDDIRRAHALLPPRVARAWRWWRLQRPVRSPIRLADVIQLTAPYDPPEINKRRPSELSSAHALKIEKLRMLDRPVFATGYRRTRDGVPVIEIRNDGIAGCLRTAAGGSSRQILFKIESGELSSRLLTGRECARLMGLPDSFILPSSATKATTLAEDGVAVPVVQGLVSNLIEPAVGLGALVIRSRGQLDWFELASGLGALSY